MFQIGRLLGLSHQIYPIRGNLMWMIKETLICKVMKLWLHQEPYMHFSDMAANEVDIQRRLWVWVVETSTQSSFESDLSLLISSEVYNCIVASNLDDTGLLVNPSLILELLAVYGRSMMPMLLANTQGICLYSLQLLSAPDTALTYQDVLKLTNGLHGVHKTPIARRQFLTASSTRVIDYHIKVQDAFTCRFPLILHAPFVIQAKKNLSY